MNIDSSKNHLLMALSIVAVIIFAFPVYLNAEENCLKSAWIEFNKSDYRSAIKYADQCVDNFKKNADREEKRLEKIKEPLPLTGEVSQSEKNKIFNRGLLNDVATAFYVKGRSAEHLYKSGSDEAKKFKQMAISAYKMAIFYKYARTWDSKGFFWAPCDAASDRLPL